MKKHILQAYRILTRIFEDGTYSNMALYDENVSEMATLLVYGVLENNLRTEYIISRLADKKPQKSVAVLLKIGIYALENLTDVPKFAIVSECVEAAKAIGKGGVGGFVNAVLKRVANGDYRLPESGDKNYLSVTYSKPQWFIDKLQKQYGYDTMIEIISAKSAPFEHIRINTRVTNVDYVLSALKQSGEKAELSEVGGLTVRVSKTVKKLFDGGYVTYQSPSSMIAVQALSPNDGDNVLDVCSAPGGKAVYASELCRQGKVTACELYPHRMQLIEKYKKRMRADNVNAVRYDATVFNPEWEEKFDCVLADVPCSCFGTFLKHPDVFLSRGKDDINEICLTQRAILKNAARYVKPHGTLVYSTCTLFKEENGDAVSELCDKGGFEPVKITCINDVDNGRYADNDGTVQILPHGVYDGFYVAKLRKL